MSNINNALTTLAKVADYQIVADNLILQHLISAASNAIELYCNRKFSLMTHSETKNGTNSSYLMLKNYPIKSIIKLTIDGELVNDFEINECGEKGILYRKSGWTAGERNIEIEYQAGFDIIPDDIQLACIYLVKSLLGEDINKQSERIGDYSVTYAIIPDSKFPRLVHALLGPYRSGVV